MQLHEQLATVGVPSFPCWLRWNPTKNRYDKGPRVPAGESWQLSALRPPADPVLNWASGVIGVPVPPRVVILDLDSYKGVTRYAVDQLLGCALPWDAALIQRTVGGGEHYAFRCEWEVRQGDSIGLEGFDTRSAGRGFICSGAGYSPVNFGIMALAYPDALPLLPDACRRVLERVEQPPSPAPAPTDPDDVNVGEITEALRHIDPGCSRTQWRNICYALKKLFQHDDDTGHWLCEQWSSGELWHDGAPENYVPEGKGSVADQWPTFKPDGGVHPSTLYYHAMRGGWNPPRTFNAAAAFGAEAAPADVFGDLIDRVRAEAADVKAVPELVEAIRLAGCNRMQTALLLAELKSELKDAKLLDKSVAGVIDTALPADPTVYSTNDSENALTYMSRRYPNGGLLRCDQELYEYTGRVWEKLPRELLEHRIAHDMVPSRASHARIASCVRLVATMAPEGAIGGEPGRFLVFQNGVLCLETFALHPHSPDYLATTLLPYDYDPAAGCPAWLSFLDGTLDGDRERVMLLQEWLGYLLSGDTRQQKIMMMLGPKRCGKGTIGRVLQHLVGHANFTGGSLSSFATDSFLDMLRLKPVLFVGDAEKKISPAKVNQVIERLKSISGNDEVAFDRKYLSGVSVTLPTRVTVALNGIPNLFDDSGALASRMLILPFYRSFFGAEDLTLADRLLPELAGIASWALVGLYRLRQQGRFTEPQASREEERYLRSAYSPLAQFIEDCCTVEPNTFSATADLYMAYKAWAMAEGDEILRRRTFTSALKDNLRGRGVYYGSYWVDEKAQRGFKGLKMSGQVVTSAQSAFIPKIV